MGSEKKAPEMRFGGYPEPWEQDYLIDIFSPAVGSNTLSRAELNYEGGEVKNIHYGDILIKFGSFLDAASNEIPFIANGIAAEHRGNLLRDGDIVLADTAEDETVGKAVEVTNSGGTNIVAGLHTIAYRPKREFSAYFAGYCLNSNTYRHQLLSLMQGIKVLSLSRGNLAKTSVCYPASVDEQAAIGNFFRSIDDIIALKKQQYEKTINIKKAMLEKMFPKNGADAPEIRFEGYSKAWTKYSFFDTVAKTIDFRGRTPRKLGMDWSESGYIALSALNVKNGYIDFSAEPNFGSEELYQRWMTGNELRKGQVLFTTEAPMGNVAQVPDNRKYILSQRTIAFNFKEDIWLSA